MQIKLVLCKRRAFTYYSECPLPPLPLEDRRLTKILLKAAFSSVNHSLSS